MTYFGFLALFVGLPILFLLAATWWDRRQGRQMPAGFNTYSPGLVLLAHVIVALLYTTPWDNYLVANSVWWYDPQKVTGLVIGWVPIEEYTFFIVQPIMTGLWFLFLARRRPAQTGKPWTNNRLRRVSTGALGLLWLVALGLWLGGGPQFVYLTLILLWALPPIMLQTAFGADILLRHGRLVLLGFGIPTLYLALADAVAIASGVWTIDPAQSVHFLLGGILPVEEFLFFLVTNVLIILGMTLVLAAESQLRVAEWTQILRSLFRRPPNRLSPGDKAR